MWLSRVKCLWVKLNRLVLPSLFQYITFIKFRVASMILVLKEKIALLSIKTRLATFIGIKQD